MVSQNAEGIKYVPLNKLRTDMEKELYNWAWVREGLAKTIPTLVEACLNLAKLGPLHNAGLFSWSVEQESKKPEKMNMIPLNPVKTTITRLYWDGQLLAEHRQMSRGGTTMRVWNLTFLYSKAVEWLVAMKENAADDEARRKLVRDYRSDLARMGKVPLEMTF